MRVTTFALAAILAVPAPAAAQLHASINIAGIRIGAHIPIIDRRAPRYVRVVDYSPRYAGDWRRDARYWRPVEVWVLDGRYYERPYRNARRVIVYRYRNQYFHAPRDRDWNRSRDRFNRDYWRFDRWDDRRDDRRDNRADRRDDRRDNRTDRRNDRRDDRADRRGDRRDDRGNRGNNGRGGGRRGS